VYVRCNTSHLWQRETVPGLTNCISPGDWVAAATNRVSLLSSAICVCFPSRQSGGRVGQYGPASSTRDAEDRFMAALSSKLRTVYLSEWWMEVTTLHRVNFVLQVMFRWIVILLSLHTLPQFWDWVSLTWTLRRV